MLTYRFGRTRKAERGAVERGAHECNIPKARRGGKLRTLCLSLLVVIAVAWAPSGARATAAGYTDTVWMLIHGCTTSVNPYVMLALFNGGETLAGNTPFAIEYYDGGTPGLLSPTLLTDIIAVGVGNPVIYFKGAPSLLFTDLNTPYTTTTGDLATGLNASAIQPDEVQYVEPDLAPNNPDNSQNQVDGVGFYHRGQSFITQFEAAFCNPSCQHPAPIPFGFPCTP